uniref:DUF4371 domain-containing protein n=1 Tax=Octopus bimaculoides TaxID=37653 RepID=A0A0L8FKZ5_OCTBM
MYVHNNRLEDEFLFCKNPSTKTTAREIFNKADKFFEAHNINSDHVIVVCTDGAPAMLGCRSGFQTLVKEKSPDVIDTHCTVYRQAQMVKIMPDELKNVLNYVITAVNFIKANALNFRLFAELCKESDSEFASGMAFERKNNKESIPSTKRSPRFFYKMPSQISTPMIFSNLLGIFGGHIRVSECHQSLTARERYNHVSFS